MLCTVSWFYFGGDLNVIDMEYALSVIYETASEWYQPPEGFYHRKRIYFKYETYKRAAIKEILLFLMTCEESDPIEALKHFSNKISDFVSLSKNDEMHFMFSIYQDVVLDIIDILSAML